MKKTKNKNRDAQNKRTSHKAVESNKKRRNGADGHRRQRARLVAA